MSTHVPGFQSFSSFLHQFVLAKLANSSIRVKPKVTLEKRPLDLMLMNIIWQLTLLLSKLLLSEA